MTDVKAKEPLILNKPENGRPSIAEEQYQKWLDDMRPFLRQGCTLRYAIDRMELTKHSYVIYEKYKQNDWFSNRVDALRATVGELINNIGFKTVESMQTRMVEAAGQPLFTDNEIKIWKTMAERHRSAQPFFVNRTETAESDESKVGKIIDTLEGTDYGNLASEAQEQVVATDAPVQDKGQAGAVGDLQTEPNPTSTHN